MFKLTDCISILGSRGCGKSFLCKNVQRVFPKVVVIDTLKEYTPEEEAKRGGVIFDNFEVFAEALFEAKSKRKKRFRFIFQFDVEEENKELIFDQLLRVLYKCGNLMIVIEEVQLHATTHKLPFWFKNCLLTGRHQNLSIAITTQRPGELNKTILSQCNHIFAGQMHEKNDLKYVSNFLGTDSEKLSNLEKRKFLYWRPGEKILIVSNNLQNKT